MGKYNDPILIDSDIICWFDNQEDINGKNFCKRINEVLRLQMYKEVLILSEERLNKELKMFVDKG